MWGKVAELEGELSRVREHNLSLSKALATATDEIARTTKLIRVHLEIDFKNLEKKKKRRIKR